ncbi:MAG TPA: ATP-binding protein [Gallionella sp.]|nr:ATP-binding protein [Gallionella sp.]
MKQFGKFSIRQQVAWLTLTPLFIMAVGLESFFLHSRFSDLDQGLLERGKLIARQLASSSEYGVFSNNQAFLQNIANGVLQQPDVRSVVILNAASESLVNVGEFSGIPDKTFTDKALVMGGLAGQVSMERVDIREEVDLLTPIRSDREGLRIYQPIIPVQVALEGFGERRSAQMIGAVIVEMSRLHTKEVKTRMLRVTVTITALFLVLSFYLVHLASRSITYPIGKLSDAVQSIGRGNFATRISLQTHVSELNTLAQGLNDMTTQLQQEHATLQQRIKKATQALLVKKEEAEHASHDKSHFLAVASHDLRQPLHALGLYVAELQRKVSNAEQRHLVAQVERSIEALSTLLNALLDISKLDAGAVIPQMQTCAVNAMLGRIAADYQMLASVKNIRLIVRPCTGYVTSDPLLLERILANLVSNAIRYTYQNGCVMVACRRRGHFLRIEVRDNGVGISKTDQGNIYREFFQLAQPQLDTNKGLGLGLAIVDRLVKLLGHRIELRSAPGKGSVFALEVPITSNSGRSSMAAAEQVSNDLNQEVEKSPLAGKRLLIVDDDAAVLSGTTGILTSWGCKVNAAASVTQVEQFLRDGVKWDLIVSDYQLGSNANGIDIIDLVRQHQNQRIPCILISGDTSPTVLKLASVSGHHLLHKPVRPAKLRSLIEHLLEDDARQIEVGLD